MKRSTKPYRPHCFDCDKPIEPDSDHYRWDSKVKVLIRTCRTHRQGTRKQLLDLLGEMA